MSASPEFHIDEKNKSRFVSSGYRVPHGLSMSLDLTPDRNSSDVASQSAASMHNLALSNRQANSVSGFLHSER
jgi:hypothetical protein